MYHLKEIPGWCVAEIELPLSITAAIKLKIKLPPYFQAIKTAELLYLSGTSPAQAEITGRRSDGRTLDSVVVRPVQSRVVVSQSVSHSAVARRTGEKGVSAPTGGSLRDRFFCLDNWPSLNIKFYVLWNH